MTGSRHISESDCSVTDQSSVGKLPLPGLDILRAIRGPSHMRVVEVGTWVGDDSNAAWSDTAVGNPSLAIQLYHQAICRTAFRATATSLPFDAPYLFLRRLLNDRPDQTASIGDFPGEPYRTLKPIPVVLKWTGDEYLARFDKANIAMSGSTCSEALGNLAACILDTLEDYSSEPTLGPEPARQLAVLRQYVVER